MAKKTTTAKKRVVKVEATGEAHISSTFNNVIIALTNNVGQVISWSSAGRAASEAPRRTLRMQLRLQQKMLPRLHSMQASAK